MIKQSIIEDAYQLGINYANTEHEFYEHVKTHGSKFASEFNEIISYYQNKAVDEFNEKHNMLYTYVVCHANTVCVTCVSENEKIEYTFNI